jgi:hypothetical protein
MRVVLALQSMMVCTATGCRIVQCLATDAEAKAAQEEHRIANPRRTSGNGRSGHAGDALTSGHVTEQV